MDTRSATTNRGHHLSDHRPSYTSLSPLPTPWLPCVSRLGSTTTAKTLIGTPPFFPSRFSRGTQIRYLYPPNRSIRIREQRILVLVFIFLVYDLLLLPLFLESFPIGTTQPGQLSSAS